MPQTAIQPREPGSHARAVREVPPPPALPVGFQPSRELLTAWLLLLLNDGATHGYELRRLLEEHGVVTETGAMYRTIRKLENEGRAASRWEDSAAGPRRRLYQVTNKGRRDLHDLVGSIRLTRDVHTAFLQVHEASQ
jgi:DNA-binding PadR family transcriptional regulator